MKRKIISIDEDKCTGCGQCIPDCPEGAIQLIDGKARLISDLFCDGLGACIGTCPEGAISVVEREAEPYDEKKVMENIVRQGPLVIKAHLEHLASHGQKELYDQAVEYLKERKIRIPGERHPGRQLQHAPGAACPGTMARSIPRAGPSAVGRPLSEKAESELRQWPVQLSLLNPAATYFDNADLLIAADCVPFAYAGFHTELLRGKIVIIFCPKLDADIDGYVAKLTEIFKGHEIKSITVAHMEVPCCNGVRYVVDRALERAAKKIPVSEKTITIQGEIE
ncbi:MAG: Heterodisulfide reductase subunit A-like protein [Methanocella sp. PtaU1.Bin125]|nr:MAG: Heterodisulfide reductase subunit A-like protein [Methanocella sp. PtaU1.Bin125]